MGNHYDEYYYDPYEDIEATSKLMHKVDLLLKIARHSQFSIKELSFSNIEDLFVLKKYEKVSILDNHGRLKLSEFIVKCEYWMKTKYQHLFNEINYPFS